MEHERSTSNIPFTSPISENVEGSKPDRQKKLENELPNEMESLNLSDENSIVQNEEVASASPKENFETVDFEPTAANIVADKEPHIDKNKEEYESHNQDGENGHVVVDNQEEQKGQSEEVVVEQKVVEPVFDGTEARQVEGAQGSAAWPEKATMIKNLVKLKGAAAVSNVMRRLSGKKDEDAKSPTGKGANNSSVGSSKEEQDASLGNKPDDVNDSVVERSLWNPLHYIKITRNVDFQNNAEQQDNISVEGSGVGSIMHGRIILYTRLGCQDCKEFRLFLNNKALRYFEINIDVYPSRRSELENKTGSSGVPKVFFNDILVGGLSELKAMDASGKLQEMINHVINDEPSPSAPLPPLPGEDDISDSGIIDELAMTVNKMRESIVIKDRFYKMRRFTSCFLGSEAVDFLSMDQYLEREEAVEFGRKLASNHFFHHVLEENMFEDGNHPYRFLDHDPIVSTQCYNFLRGILDVKPKPVVDIAARIRFLSYAMFEAYVSEDGRHVNYQSIRSSEEFARYVRTVEELQRVDLQDLAREEKMSFFINLYNMMAIHAIITWGYPSGALERRKFFGDFKYIVGGSTYSLSAIHNGILRGNQRPPYSLMKPFSPKDARSMVALQNPEPLIHFALVSGNRSGPALRCYSPGDMDKELIEAAQDFLRNGGLVVDTDAKVASVSTILKWFSTDFGKNELEVMKRIANYLEPSKSEELLELTVSSQLKVVYQPFDWSLNSWN